jgi:hypothetical protein
MQQPAAVARSCCSKVVKPHFAAPKPRHAVLTAAVKEVFMPALSSTMTGAL